MPSPICIDAGEIVPQLLLLLQVCFYLGTKSTGNACPTVLLRLHMPIKLIEHVMLFVQTYLTEELELITLQSMEIFHNALQFVLTTLLLCYTAIKENVFLDVRLEHMEIPCLPTDFALPTVITLLTTTHTRIVQLESTDV